MKLAVALAILVPALLLPAAWTAAAGASMAKDEGEIRARLAAYATVALQADLTGLSPSDREGLAKIAAAVRAVDGIYWKQMGRQALEARQAFENASDPLDRLYRDFVLINYGPFDARKEFERFVAAGRGGPRLPGAGFYPEDMTRKEFEARIQADPELKEEFEKPTTVIRKVDGVLLAIPYERLYLEELKTAARALKEAAALVDSASLRRYLSLRAEALLGGDYYPSDLAWLEVKENLIDVVIGPIETGDDLVMGLKASYEGAALIKDVAASRALEVYRQHLDGISRALPVDERYKKTSVGAGNVIEVVDVVRFGGEFNAGIKTVAASLPNDERIIQEKGAKKQIYRNVLLAKFDAILKHMAPLFLPKRQWPLVTREAFVTNVLLHELSHTLGVDYVAGAGGLTVRKALRDLYATIEEAKADVVGVYSLAYLREKEIFSEDEVEEHYATYLAAIFRSIRFGAVEAHGLGNAVQLEFLIREGAIQHDPKKGEFSIQPKKFEPAIAKLARELLEIQGTGDYARARHLLANFGKLQPAVVEALKRCEAIPVDVTFTYPL